MTTLPHLSLSLMLLTTTVFLLAGLVKGVVGLGLPTLAMALLALAMPPAQAAALVVYGLWGLSGARVSQVPAGAERVLGPLVGAVTGLVTAATGVFVIAAVR